MKAIQVLGMMGPAPLSLQGRQGHWAHPRFLRAATTEQGPHETLEDRGPTESGGLGPYTQLTKSPPDTSASLQPPFQAEQTAPHDLK